MLDWISALINFFGILVAIGVAVWLGPWAASRQAKWDQQERLLRDLINTWQVVSNPVYQSAINHIPLDFANIPEILAARQAYLDVCKLEPPVDEGEQREILQMQVRAQSRLIAAVAKQMGFALTEEYLLATSYMSQGFVDRELALLSALHAWPRIATALEIQVDIMKGDRHEGDGA